MSEIKYPQNPILIVDDEIASLNSYELALRSVGINNIVTCQESTKLMSLFDDTAFEMVLLDIIMPELTGDKLLTKINAEYPSVPVIMITGVNEVDMAVGCMRNGAFDYLVKPIERDRLINTVNKALQIAELHRENDILKESILSNSLNNPDAFKEIITQNKSMLSTFNYCEAIALSRQPILVTGETGVGKELFAKALYNLSPCSGAFVTVNVAGLDDNMFSDTLFGHVKGAFTGAADNRGGLVEKAAGGLLFLDEIGDLSIPSQVKLLRLLQEKEYSPLGADFTKATDARVIVATHQDIAKSMEKGTFRKDLYYRLKTHQIQIPPLRNRLDDIRLLLDFFIDMAAKEMGKQTPSYHPSLISLLKSYSYPGNVRELRGMVFDAVSNHKSHILSTKVFKSHLSDKLTTTNAASSDDDNQQAVGDSWVKELSELPSIKEAAGILVNEAMRRSDNNQRVASRMLGISHQALSKRLKNM